jgi:hypothetical protein
MDRGNVARAQGRRAEIGRRGVDDDASTTQRPDDRKKTEGIVAEDEDLVACQMFPSLLYSRLIEHNMR